MGHLELFRTRENKEATIAPSFLLSRRCVPMRTQILALCFFFAFATIRLCDADGPRYKNPRWGFCFSLPPGWFQNEAFDDAGVMLSLQNYEKTKTAIRVGALPNQPRDILSDDPTRMTLEDYVDNYKRGLLDLRPRPTDLRVLPPVWTHLHREHAVVLQAYYMQQRSQRYHESIFVLHAGLLFSLELQCPREEVAPQRSVLENIMATFRFKC